MGRELRLVLIAATVVVLLGIVSLLLWLNPAEVVESGVTLKAVEPVDVARALITNQHGTFEIALTDEGYQVDDLPAELVDMPEFIELMTHSGKIHALRTVPLRSGSPLRSGVPLRGGGDGSPGALAPYGLDEPAAQAEISYVDGSTLTLLIGDMERVTGNYYTSIAGDPAVYLMAAERCAGFLLPKRAYIEDLVTPELALSSPLSALLDVTFTGGRLTEPVTVEAVATGDPEVVRAALSLGAPTHIIRGKGTYKLDQTYAVEMMGPLLGITAHDVVGYGLTQEEILALGFDQPTMQVAFDLRNGADAEVEHYDLALLCQDGACTLTCNDNGVIYAVEEPAFLQLEYSKLLVRWFLSPLLIDVRAIELSTGSEQVGCVISGETNAEKQVVCNGQDLDITRFRDLYRLLTSAAHDGRLLDDAGQNPNAGQNPDVVVTGAPLLQLTYHYLDEQKTPDVMKLYPGDARRVYVEVNGVIELAMRETYLTRVQGALRTLWTDEPIVTEW